VIPRGHFSKGFVSLFGTSGVPSTELTLGHT
jgi:hypothetical protein